MISDRPTLTTAGLEPVLARACGLDSMPTRNNNISLRGLRTFCVAAELVSFREAADRLFITASAVSHQIKNLEDELGQRLFDRNSRSLSLSAAGKALYADVAPIIAELDDIASKHKHVATRKALRISVQPFFASEYFVPRLSEFADANPDIDIKLDTSDESPEKHPGNADASIRVFRSAPANLVADRLFPLRLVPAASKAFKKALRVKAGRVTSDFPLIVHDTRPMAWKQWEKVSRIELPKDSKTTRLDSMIAVARAAERGLGAALVPVDLSASWFESGDLVKLFDHELVTTDAYYFVCDHGVAKHDPIRRLRSWVLQSFGEEQ